MSSQDYTYENGVLKILTETPITISNVGAETSARIEVALDADGTANLTLACVSIDVPLR
ncbi:hypothetical protein [Ruminococcus gauvreauii]|uniref:hypothetical protein n=1 Tax=Ruminococcus gauvreauii TaxID=438033 RepID=UPI00398429E0